jgi:nucleotide-binding universal stress UspA family protein
MAVSILAPFDGSALAESGLRCGAALARATGARLLLLHVVPEVAYVSRAEQAMAAIARRLRDEGTEVQVAVKPGDAAQVIVDVATASGASLIALSTHGQGGLGRWLYGSVAARVLRATPVPVLLVPAGCVRAWPVGRPLRILVALDGSGFAQEALAPVALLAGAQGAHIVLVQVVEPAVTPETWRGNTYVALRTAQSIVEARAYLEQMAGTLRGPTVIVETCARAGAPAATLLEIAREYQVDLIAMTTHGWSGVSPVCMGRVAAGVLQDATMPILLVRPEWVRRTAADALLAAPPILPEPDELPISIGLTGTELALVLRGLERLLGEVRPEEPVYALCARLRQAKAVYDAEARRMAHGRAATSPASPAAPPRERQAVAYAPAAAKVVRPPARGSD